MRLIDADLVKPAMENSDDSLLNQPMTIRHVESLLDDLPTVQVVSLDRIKEAREEISKMRKEHNVSVTDCLDVLDKLIAEVEG